MRAAWEPAPVAYEAHLGRWIQQKPYRGRAANDNRVPDRAASLSVAIRQLSVVIAGICGIMAIAAGIAH